MEDMKDIAYCGLYCRLCAMMSRIPQTAGVLRRTMAEDGWEFYGEFIEPQFRPFWETLRRLADYESTCPACRGGCGNPDCAIRKCAVDRGVTVCPLCDAYPCENIRVLARRYPNLIADGERLREAGVETWVREQEQRRDAGVCYRDFRIPADVKSE